MIMEKVDQEIKERTDSKELWRLNQAGTSLCGMGCIFYLFAKEQPESYAKFAKELFRTGEAKHNTYTVKPSNEFFEKKINKRGFPLGVGSAMPLIDFVTFAGTRNSSNPKYKGGNEEFQAINWPPLMTKLAEELLGYKKVSSKYDPIKKPTSYLKLLIIKIIEDINKQIADGYRLILMIDSDLINPTPDTVDNIFELEYHWVVLQTPINLLDNLDSNGIAFYTLNCKIFTPWGPEKVPPKYIICTEPKYLKEPITLEHFIHNYYGYIKVK